MSALSVPINDPLRLLVMVHVYPEDCMVGVDGPRVLLKYQLTVKQGAKLPMVYVPVEELHIEEGPEIIE